MSRASWTFLPGFVRRFLATETAAGAACVAAIVLAMVWVNSGWHASYASFWDTSVASSAGPVHLPGSLAAWVAEGGMAIFFFVVGLEVKRELVAGELRHWRAAALPVFSAAAGMVVPAVLYIAIAAGTSAEHGWAIPMATDLAVALGVVAVLGDRVPAALKVFLLTLAVADDIGAVVVIALVLPGELRLTALAVAVVLVGVLAGISRTVKAPWLIVALAVGVWLATLRSGIHPTVAGVAVAFALPTDARSMRIEERMHRFASMVIVPLFVVSAAGVRLAGTDFSGDAGRVAVAVAVGFVAGKTIGVVAGAYALVRLGLGRLPSGTSWSQMVGAAFICGIGLTVAVLVTDLSLASTVDRSAAKLGVLGAAVIAGLAGAVVLARAAPPPSASDDDERLTAP